MATYKHFTLNERNKIEQSLNQSLSFKAIGRLLNRDCTTIAKEVKKHFITKKIGCYGSFFNNCLHRSSCKHSNLCSNESCKFSFCRQCPNCSSYCKDFIEEICPILSKSPYVCNACKNLNRCRLEKHHYSAKEADKRYRLVLSDVRSGITANEEDILRLNKIISPLIMKGQSIHHICSHNSDAIMYSEQTIYNYTDYNLFSARNIDLPRKVKYKPRKVSKDRLKVDKSCRIGRSYEDFLKFMTENPDTPLVEMDSVEGRKGGKVLLTIHFKQTEFMLAFIRDNNTSRSVTDIFDRLYYLLSLASFDKLFPVILTDNGSEFSNPSAIEFDAQDNRKSRIFYCDPSSPYQKGSIENNHELIRRVLPKGTSFDNLTQDDIDLMMNHINSYGRKKLNTQCPHQVFESLYGSEILNKLGAKLIPFNEIILIPKLIQK